MPDTAFLLMPLVMTGIILIALGMLACLPDDKG